MDYPGKELEIFDTAKIFQKYIYLHTKKYLKDGILEIGAGLGSFSKNYIGKFNNICLSDLDEKNNLILKKRFSSKKNVRISKEKIDETKLKFNTIIYLNVLEHIKEDNREINLAISKLNSGGHLIILVPAHQKLYTKFDEAIGHCRRYDINFFKENKYKGTKIKKVLYLDMIGYFLYFLNKMFFKEEVYPSKFKIFLWDKIFTPITIVLDYLSFYKFGKNILCIFEKE